MFPGGRNRPKGLSRLVVDDDDDDVLFGCKKEHYRFDLVLKIA